MIRGELRAGDERRAIREGQMARFGAGHAVRLATDVNAGQPVELLLLGGQPLNEPVERHGPFVMNTREEILQAIQDYQTRRMGQINF